MSNVYEFPSDNSFTFHVDDVEVRIKSPDKELTIAEAVMALERTKIILMSRAGWI